MPAAKPASEQSYHEVDVRQQIGVPRLLYVLKHYYWVQVPSEAAKGIGRNKKSDAVCLYMPVGSKLCLVSGVRPTVDEVQSLRSFLLLIVKQLVLEVALTPYNG